MSDAENHEELSDVALCYKAMGLEMDASPDEIEQTYARLTEGFRKELASSDPAVREQARVSIMQVKELYDKIKTSVTYAAKVRDHEKQVAAGKVDAVAAERLSTDSKLRKSSLQQCSSCKGYIAVGLKQCPYCRARILSKTENALRAVFTPLNVTIICLVLIIGVLAVVAMLYPSQLSALADWFISTAHSGK